MERNIKITRGAWKAVLKNPNFFNKHDIIDESGQIFIAEVLHMDGDEQNKANAILIAEAGTIYNETGLSPNMMREN